MQEGDIKKDHDSLVRKFQDLRARDKTSGDAIGKLELTVKAIEDSIVRLEATVEKQVAIIEQRDEDLDAQQEDL